MPVSESVVVVFDLDGTLIHSAPDLQAAVNVALTGAGRREVTLAETISFIGNGVPVLVERALKATGDWSQEVQSETLSAFSDYYEKHTTTLTRPYPGAVACLERLSAAGVPMGICTNKPEAPARSICDALDLTRFFPVISGARPDLPRKPDPAGLTAVISELGGLPHRALYVGDSAVDYRTAHNAAVPFRLFSGGYLNHELPQLTADQIFDTWDAAGIEEALSRLS